MSGLKKFWQTLIQRFSPRAPWSAGDLEREFSVARQEREHLLGQLVDLQAEFEQRVSAGQRERQDLLDQLTALHARVEQELAASGLEKQALRGELNGLRSEVRHSLKAAHQEHQDLLGQIGALRSEFEQELESVYQEQQGLRERLNANQAEVERGFAAAREERQGLQGELERIKSTDEALRVDLEQRFEQIRIERDAADQELVALRTLLADAGARQKAADTRVNSLKNRLNEQRQEYDIALQQTLIRERRLGRRLKAAMTVAVAAFVLGVVGGAINFWQVNNSTRVLGEVSQGIQDIQATIAGQSSADIHGPSPHSPAPIPENNDASHVSNSSPADAASTPPKRGNSEPEFVGE